MKRRRLYDVMNVLEAVGVTERISKGACKWHGASRVGEVLGKLVAEAPAEDDGGDASSLKSLASRLMQHLGTAGSRGDDPKSKSSDALAPAVAFDACVAALKLGAPAPDAPGAKRARSRGRRGDSTTSRASSSASALSGSSSAPRGRPRAAASSDGSAPRRSPRGSPRAPRAPSSRRATAQASRTPGISSSRASASGTAPPRTPPTRRRRDRRPAPRRRRRPQVRPGRAGPGGGEGGVAAELLLPARRRARAGRRPPGPEASPRAAERPVLRGEARRAPRRALLAPDGGVPGPPRARRRRRAGRGRG